MIYSMNPEEDRIVIGAMKVAGKEPRDYVSHTVEENGDGRSWLEIRLGDIPYQYVRVFKVSNGDFIPVTSKTRLVTTVECLPRGAIVKARDRYMTLCGFRDGKAILCPEYLPGHNSQWAVPLETNVEVTVSGSNEGVIVGGVLAMTREEVEKHVDVSAQEFMLGCKFDVLQLVKKVKGGCNG